MWFPLNLHTSNVGIPINNHPGAFGNVRRHHIHEGVDLYGKEGDWVFAMKDGIVIANEPFTGPSANSDWWLDTNAVIIFSETEYYVYGELQSHLKAGDIVKAGDKIGELLPVLPADKIRPDLPGHSNVMLHLEKLNSKWKHGMGWTIWEKRDERPDYLEDPTNDLILALTRKFQPVKLLTL